MKVYELTRKAVEDELRKDTELKEVIFADLYLNGECNGTKRSWGFVELDFITYSGGYEVVSFKTGMGNVSYNPEVTSEFFKNFDGEITELAEIMKQGILRKLIKSRKDILDFSKIIKLFLQIDHDEEGDKNFDSLQTQIDVVYRKIEGIWQHLGNAPAIKINDEGDGDY